MPASVIGSQAIALHTYQALFGQAPSNALYASYVSQIGTTDGSAFAASLAAGFASTTSAALSTTVLKNLGVTATTMPATATVTAAAAYTALESALTALFTANPTARGQVILNLTNLLANLEGDVTYGAIATAYNTQTTNNFAYSSNTANTAPATVTTATATAGSTFTLTTGADTFSTDSTVAASKTTAGDDTLRGDTGGATLNSTDTIDGGAGTDTLNALLVSATAVKPFLKNVEKLVLTTSTGATAQIDLADSTGVAEVWHKGDAAAGVSLVASNVALTSAVGVMGTQKSAELTTFTFANATGSNDSGTLLLQEAVVGAAADTVTVLAVENLTVKVSDIASTTTNVSTINSLVVTNAKTITVTGDVGTLTLGGNAAGVSNFKALTKFDASGLKGNLVLDLSAATATGATVADAGVTFLSSNTGTNTITFGTNTLTDTIKFVTGNVSTINKLTTITDFNEATQDKLDISAFALGADTTVGATVVAVAGDIAGFFTGTNRVVLNEAKATVYVDVNKDGNFSAGTDLAVVLTGVTAAGFTAADLILA